jgi:hypothetical protein
MFISKRLQIDFETNVSDKSFIKEQRFEAIRTFSIFIDDHIVKNTDISENY